MALESALEDQLFGHFCGDEAMQRIKVREREGRRSRGLLCKTKVGLGRILGSFLRQKIGIFCVG